MTGPTILFCVGELVLIATIGVLLYSHGHETGHEKGYKLGKQAGHDEQWLDDFLAQGRRRCGRCGRFSQSN